MHSDSDEYVDSDNPEWAQPDERGRKRRRSRDKWKRNMSKKKRNQCERVCKRFFLKLYMITNGRLQRVQEKLLEGRELNDGRGKHATRLIKLTEDVKDLIMTTGVSSAKAKDVRKLLCYVSAGKRSALEEYLQHINGVADNENGFDVDD
ncbi:hypothetical protein HPB47_019451 [Ixodes persulcatus]|uniref:Uncharacterized protein n=1 Tax=Ixodes persulcatus TaxID=34615 RepID=A0AC60QKP8_IXOPE|nr:hypothetical protein HPB47_019451 [Ixodes persulcatus]